MDERTKLTKIREYLEKTLKGFKLEHSGQDRLTGNYYFRFHGKTQRLRLEIREEVLEDQSAKQIITRLKEWSGSNVNETAFRIYPDRIDEVPWESH